MLGRRVQSDRGDYDLLVAVTLRIPKGSQYLSMHLLLPRNNTNDFDLVSWISQFTKLYPHLTTLLVVLRNYSLYASHAATCWSDLRVACSETRSASRCVVLAQTAGI
jgi:hypothetical protein